MPRRSRSEPRKKLSYAARQRQKAREAWQVGDTRARFNRVQTAQRRRTSSNHKEVDPLHRRLRMHSIQLRCEYLGLKTRACAPRNGGNVALVGCQSPVPEVLERGSSNSLHLSPMISPDVQLRLAAERSAVVLCGPECHQCQSLISCSATLGRSGRLLLAPATQAPPVRATEHCPVWRQALPNSQHSAPREYPTNESTARKSLPSIQTTPRRPYGTFAAPA